MFELWSLALAAGGVIVTIVLFFTSVKASIDRLCEEVAANKVFLSDEHKRHDEKLSNELQGVIRGLEGHISNEEVESARQEESRRHVRDIVKAINKIQCNMKER